MKPNKPVVPYDPAKSQAQLEEIRRRLMAPVIPTADTRESDSDTNWQAWDEAEEELARKRGEA